MKLGQDLFLLDLELLVCGRVLLLAVGSVTGISSQGHTEELARDAFELFKCLFCCALHIMEVNQSQSASELLSQDLREGLIKLVYRASLLPGKIRRHRLARRRHDWALTSGWLLRSDIN